MRLKRLLLRYYPPGIVLEYLRSSGALETRTIDILSLTDSSNLSHLASEIIAKEPLLSESRRQLLEEMLLKLVVRQSQSADFFRVSKVLSSHVLPLTNCAFNKKGDTLITGSYDRTCRVWDVPSGREKAALMGHDNVVYSLAFNFPICDKVVTGSFDKSAKIWEVCSGKCLTTLQGHLQEVVCVCFAPCGEIVGTASMDSTARLWNVETGDCLAILQGHRAEIVSLAFSSCGRFILTGSFDKEARIWAGPEKIPCARFGENQTNPISLGECVHVLIGHDGEISAAEFNFNATLCVTASIDCTCILWGVESGEIMATFAGHSDEVLDVCFDPTGSLLASCSADCTARIYDCETLLCLVTLVGHEAEISQCAFSPNGKRLLTASADTTAKVWDVASGVCLQTLRGHEDEIFSCHYNYFGDHIVTASKDNSCRVWTPIQSL